jgi:Holliday junction resolvase
MNSKTKGNRGEWELLHRLEELGISAKRNDQRYIGGVDNADIDIYGAHIEVKRTEHLRLHEAMRQAVHDANGKAMPCVMSRRDREGWLVTMNLSDWSALYKAWVDVQSRCRTVESKGGQRF